MWIIQNVKYTYLKTIVSDIIYNKKNNFIKDFTLISLLLLFCNNINTDFLEKYNINKYIWFKTFYKQHYCNYLLQFNYKSLKLVIALVFKLHEASETFCFLFIISSKIGFMLYVFTLKSALLLSLLR